MAAPNRLWILLAVVSAALAAYILWPRAPDAPEELIKRQVNRMTVAASERDVSGVMEYVSDRFRTEDGAMDKQGLKGFLAAQILRGQWVRAWPVKMEPQLTSSTTADFVGTFVLSRSEATRVQDLPKDSIFGSWEIRGKLELEGDVWRFVSASYRPVDATQVF